MIVTQQQTTNTMEIDDTNGKYTIIKTRKTKFAILVTDYEDFKRMLNFERDEDTLNCRTYDLFEITNYVDDLNFKIINSNPIAMIENLEIVMMNNN
jgi:hypothetical protein